MSFLVGREGTAIRAGRWRGRFHRFDCERRWRCRWRRADREGGARHGGDQHFFGADQNQKTAGDGGRGKPAGTVTVMSVLRLPRLAARVLMAPPALTAGLVGVSATVCVGPPKLPTCREAGIGVGDVAVAADGEAAAQTRAVADQVVVAVGGGGAVDVRVAAGGAVAGNDRIYQGKGSGVEDAAARVGGGVGGDSRGRPP